jgi:hypothetical protein
MTLAQAPAALVGPDGVPVNGRYQGLARLINWSDLAPPHARSRWWRRFHHKRWHYVAMSSGELFCAVAIVDLGWTSTAFAYAFDRRTRKIVASYSQDGLPGMSATLADSAGQGSRFRMLANTISIAPDGGGFALTLRCPGFAIDAHFGGDAPLLLAVGPVAAGSMHATQKSGGLPLEGRVKIGAASYSLDGGVASFDYSNGLLARETDWRWASAHGMGIGFNLQAGYFGAAENALWIDGGIVALGAAEFAYDAADPLAPWQVRTDDGLLDLVFHPEGARREDKDLLVAASRYVQPIGTFSGTVRAAPGAPQRRIEALAGVTEDHSSRW